MRLLPASVTAAAAVGAALAGSMVVASTSEIAKATHVALSCQISTVMLVGDSLTVGMTEAGYGKPYLAAQVPAVFKVSGERGRATNKRRVSEFTGLPTTPGTTVLSRSRFARDAQAWVVELGTNDTYSSSRYLKDIEAVMNLAAGRPVWWVNVYRGAKYADPAVDPINVALQQAAAIYPNLRIVDWASNVNAHKGWVRRDAVRTHPNPNGSKALADLIAGSLHC